MLTTTVPADWRALQTAVGQILSECGFAVTVEKQVPMVRGTAEIDVWAEEAHDGRRYVTLVECKHWRARVPQTVVHAFRTVLADVGAHVGYIVSTSGFQEGAYQAAANSNVELVSWQQFQSRYAATWFERYMSPTIAEKLDPLLTYTEPLIPSWVS